MTEPGENPQIEEAMFMLQDVPGATLVERVARLSKWYLELKTAPQPETDKEALEALVYLGNAVYFCADIHPDDRNEALDTALAYYNSKMPRCKVEPSGLGFHRLIHPAQPETAVVQETFQLQAKDQLGEWVNIYPAQVEWMSKVGYALRATESSYTRSYADRQDSAPQYLADAQISHGALVPSYADRAQSATAFDPELQADGDAEKRYSAREQLAAAIYDAMPFDDDSYLKSKPPWIPGGNSLKQDEARRLADAALSHPAEPPEDHGEDRLGER